MEQQNELEQKIRELGTYEVLDHRYLPDVGSDSYVLRHKKSGARVALLPNSDSNKVFYIAFRTPPTDSTGVAHIIEHTVLCGSRDFPVKDPFIEVAKGSLNTFLNAMTYPDKTVYPVASTNEKDFDNLVHVYLDAVFHPNIYTNENIFRQEGWHYEVTDPSENASGSSGESAKASASVNETETLSDDKSSEVHKSSEIVSGEKTGIPIITVNGVVYNEMKGVMSSADDVLNDAVLSSLYPDTTYSIISGGDPKVIPTLSYEQYLDFHRRYYHPSNAYLYLYGDMDMIRKLQYLDEAYLSQYDYAPVDSSIRGQKPFENPVEVTKNYSIQKDEDSAGKTYLSWNVALPIHGDAKTILAFKVLDYVLCDAEGAPVKEALRKKGIGQDVQSLYESGIYEPYYSVSSKYTDPDKKQEFLETIRTVLEGLVKNGIDEKALRAGINYYEFHYREADFGSYPKGLICGLDVMDTWLYDEQDVWSNLDMGKYFDELKAGVGNGYFEGLIRRYLLDNPHKSVVILNPEPGMTEKDDEAQRQKMEQFAASLSPEQLQKIRDDEASLRKWQETPDTEENLAKIPILSRQDLKRETDKPFNLVIPMNVSSTGNVWNGMKDRILKSNVGKSVKIPKNESADMFLLNQPVFTSGIDYVSLSFDITNLPERLMKWVSVFKTLLCALSTEHYSYSELDNEINIETGGMTPAVSDVNQVSDPSQFQILYTLVFKTMSGNLSKALDLACEVLLHTSYDDTDRIHEVLEEEVASMKEDLQAGGHQTAMIRASSYLSSEMKIMDDIVGVGAYRFLNGICNDWERRKDELVAAMKELTAVVFTRERLLVSVTAPEEQVKEDLPLFEEFTESIPFMASGEQTYRSEDHSDHHDKADLFEKDKSGEQLVSAAYNAFSLVSGKFSLEEPYRPVPEKLNEGFKTAGQVQFVCRAGNYYNKGLRFDGALRVLKTILGYDYLWTRIRMKGGAYGCMSGFGRDGSSYFVTYRDPHLKQSIETFEGAADYIRHYEADERTMTKYVIGAVSTMDRPMTPNQFGHFSRICALSGLTGETLQAQRNQTLDCTVEDIHRMADYIDAFLSDEALCVVGSAQKIESEKELFGEVTTLE